MARGQTARSQGRPREPSPGPGETLGDPCAPPGGQHPPWGAQSFSTESPAFLGLGLSLFWSNLPLYHFLVIICHFTSFCSNLPPVGVAPPRGAQSFSTKSPAFLGLGLSLFCSNLPLCHFLLKSAPCGGRTPPGGPVFFDKVPCLPGVGTLSFLLKSLSLLCSTVHFAQQFILFILGGGDSAFFFKALSLHLTLGRVPPARAR